MTIPRAQHGTLDKIGDGRRIGAWDLGGLINRGAHTERNQLKLTISRAQQGTLARIGGAGRQLIYFARGGFSSGMGKLT